MNTESNHSAGALQAAVPGILSAESKHRLIAIRYRADARMRAERGPPETKIPCLRGRELERLFRDRYGRHLPDDDAGRDDFLIAAHTIAGRGKNPDKRIRAFAAAWAPWMEAGELAAVIATVVPHPRRYTALQAGNRLGLTDEERDRLRITTIRAAGVTDQEMADRRRAKDRDRKTAKRAEQRVTKPEPVSKSKPWLADGISRATWYRRKAASETKAVRSKESAPAADEICLTEPAARPVKGLSKGRVRLTEPPGGAKPERREAVVR